MQNIRAFTFQCTKHNEKHVFPTFSHITSCYIFIYNLYKNIKWENEIENQVPKLIIDMNERMYYNKGVDIHGECDISDISFPTARPDLIAGIRSGRANK